jgi:hypothetical protein
VEASSPLGQDISGCRQLQTTEEAHHEQIVVRQFALANNAILAGNNQALNNTNTENNSEINREVEENK